MANQVQEPTGNVVNDRNADGKGRGNFGNPQQHADAGRKGGESRGTDGGNQPSGSQTENTTTTEGSESEAHSSGVEALRQLIRSLVADRKHHLNAVAEIDNALKDIQGEVSGLVSEVTQTKPSDSPTGKLTPASEMGKQGKTASNSSNKGSQGSEKKEDGRSNRTGTQIETMMNILKRNGGKMDARELREAAKKEGVKSIYSALQQLVYKGKVQRESNQVVLNG